MGDEVMRAVRADPSTAPYETQVAAVLGGLVDVQVMGICSMRSGSTTRFGALGLGAAPSYVPARLASDPIADARTPGACGSGS